MAQTRNDSPRRATIGKLKMYIKGHKVTWGQALSRGKTLYGKISSELEANHAGQYVCIDIYSGEYEVAPDPKTARSRMVERHPDAVMWGQTIGHQDDGKAVKRDD